MSNIPSLTSVMTSAANQLFEQSAARQPNNRAANRNWAELRTARGIGPSGGRYAQMSTNVVNNTTTAPNFYSPFLTPSSFQIPSTRKEIYLWANWWRNNEPKVAAAINFYTNFPFNGWKLECKSNVVKDYFEKLIEKLNFQKWLPLISHSYHLYGDAFVFTEIDCPTCGGGMIDPNTGEECKHQGATWKSISILNPDSVEITPGMLSSEPRYAYLPSDREQKIVLEGNPRDLFDAIPDMVKARIRARQPIPLNPMSIHHFKHGADPWNDYGVSICKPLFVTLAYKDKLRQAQWLIAERHIIPTKIVMVGDNERPASQADLDSVQDQLSAVANDPNLTLVVPHAFDYKYVGANGQVLPIEGEFEQLDKEILDGLMLNRALLNGEGPAYGNAQVGLLSMNQRLETWRREVGHWIENNIFKKAAEWNGFYSEGDGGQQELIYPKIVFDPLRLKDNTGTLQMLVTAQQQGAISTETLVEEFGLNWDQEVERLRFEQGLNFVNSPEVMGTDMNIGFSGVTGQGFGAGSAPGGAPLGGMDMGGMGGMGGGMGDAGLGAMSGEPPAAAGISAPGGPAAPAPATAEAIHSQYKFAANLMNEIKFNREAIAQIDGREYISAVDRELNQRLVVSGRGDAGEIPDNLNAAEPWNYMPSGVPLNYNAEKLIRMSAVKKKLQFNAYSGLEKKLYKIVMQIGAPIAFYAQYEAGPGQQYRLDGAFPQIKLGIEADGEIWHNNPQKIQSDRERDITISQQGWTILRFKDSEIIKQPQDVAMVIKQAIQQLLGNYNTSPGQQTV